MNNQQDLSGSGKRSELPPGDKDRSIRIGDRGVLANGDVEFIVTGDGNIITKGDVIYCIFGEAAVPLAQHIRTNAFRSLIKDRTRDFVGREFLFNGIDDLLKDPDFRCGYIVIHGEPGIGKSALMSALVERRGYVHHFNIATDNITSSQAFLSNICAQLIIRYALDYETLPQEATHGSGFLSSLLYEIAGEEANLPLVVLIDALDEADDTLLPADANRLFLPSNLPEGVYFIVSTRPEYDYRLQVSEQEDLYLRDDDPLNLKDVRRYIMRSLEEYEDVMSARLAEWKISEEAFVEVLTEHSQGNFMYLVHVLRDIRRGRLTQAEIGDIRKLPRGLRTYYKRHWRAMKEANSARFEHAYKPVICILAAVQEPVTVEDLASSWTDLPADEVLHVLQDWQEFLNVDEDAAHDARYRIYHTSFQDFLREDVGLKYYHRRIGDTALSKIPGLGQGGSNQDALLL